MTAEQRKELERVLDSLCYRANKPLAYLRWNYSRASQSPTGNVWDLYT